MLLSERDLGQPGTAVFAGIEGTRPLLVEIQALVAPTSLGTPRRAVVGWDQAGSRWFWPFWKHIVGSARGCDVYLTYCRRHAHPGTGRRSRCSGRTGFLARQCTVTGGCGLFRRVSLSGAVRPVAQGAARLMRLQSLALLVPSCRKRTRRNHGVRSRDYTMSQASPIWWLTLQPGVKRAWLLKLVDKTGDGAAMPRYTRPRLKPVDCVVDRLTANAEMGPKIKHLGSTLPPWSGAMAARDSSRQAGCPARHDLAETCGV